MNIQALSLFLIGGGIFLLGLCVLIHRCAKDKYSFKYESKKRKFEIYPNTRDKPQTPKTTILD